MYCRKVLNETSSQRGFTLLEVLIALVVSAIIAVMAFQALDGSSRGAERTQELLDEINRLDRTWQLLSNDLRHVMKPGANVVFQAESLKSAGADAEQTVLLFKRRGWINFSNLPRSDLQLVSYRITEGQLWRDFLPDFNRAVADIDIENDGFHQLLLEHVVDIQLRFLYAGLIGSAGRRVLDGPNYTDDWLPAWPDNTEQSAAGLPLAVEITIEIEGVGPSARLFAFPEQ